MLCCFSVSSTYFSFLIFCFPGLLVFLVIGGVNLSYWPDGICSVKFLQFVSSSEIKLGGVLLKVNKHHIDICVRSGGCIPINLHILNMMEHNVGRMTKLPYLSLLSLLIFQV